jgi:hypothetical protein
MYTVIYNEWYCKIDIGVHAMYNEPVTRCLHGTCFYLYSTDVVMFAEDERSDPQAVNNSRTSAEGVIQNPATRGWRESR